MSNVILTHDASVSAFDNASGAVSTDDDGVSFNWDEQHIVRVDAPSDLEGAFDTTRFYKIEDATLARPIKQMYMADGELVTYKKPAEELRKAAWSFDNSPYTLEHPSTGMVKDVNDVHGFFRNVHYTSDDRLNGDLYIPINDSEAKEFAEENTDLSVGFFNRVVTEYDGDTGGLSNDDVDGFQVNMYGNHVAGVKSGRCSGADGCGLDSGNHGSVVMQMTEDASTVFEGEESMNNDAPSGIYVAEDGTWLAVGPNEHSDGDTEHPDDGKYPVNNCSDVSDAWGLRGSGNIDISKETLANRIQRAAEAMSCDVDFEEDATTNNDKTMGDEDPLFEVPDLSVDALAAKNDAVASLVNERDELREDIDEAETTIVDAFDEAEHFSIELDDDECACEAVEDLVGDLDSKVEEVERLEDELSEYREGDRTEALDELEELGADREAFEDESLDELEAEIERREEVLDAADDVTVKDIDTDSSVDEKETEHETTMSGTRKFGRGYSA